MEELLAVDLCFTQATAHVQADALGAELVCVVEHCWRDYAIEVFDFLTQCVGLQEGIPIFDEQC